MHNNEHKKYHAAYLKSHDMAFFMVVLSQMAANSPLAMASRAAQQSGKVPDMPVNTFLRTSSSASWRTDHHDGRDEIKT